MEKSTAQNCGIKSKTQIKLWYTMRMKFDGKEIDAKGASKIWRDNTIGP